MLEVKLEKHFNLANIKLDFSKELNEGIDVIALDIQKGIERGSQFGKAFKRNAKSTIKKKGFDHPLKEKGIMMDSGQMVKTRAQRNYQVAKLIPHIERVDIAHWNQEGTATIPARPFWGISSKAEREIMIRAKARIHQELSRA